ncbi:MAG: transposase [Candidatus Brennerbacteria bacterium]|nr:transposase [Candidatus Brennerbacteria bacterium]
MSREALRKSLPWPTTPKSGPLILVADAFVQYIEHSWHTWYCFLVRAVDGEDAVILSPICRKGTEVAQGWQESFSTLSDSILERTVALVCDGHNGLILEARRRHWLIQRCHFHLIARLQSKRSRWRRGFHQKEGKLIYQLVMQIIETCSDRTIKKSLEQLMDIGRVTTSKDVRRVISGVMTNWSDYRTYQRYPELNLPITSNTAESFIGLVRNLLHRARGFRTVRSMSCWIEALVKTQKTIKCRGKNQPN